MAKYYGYENITLIPKLCSIGSRKDADTYQKFLGREFKSPLYPSNMKCSIDLDLCHKMARNSYFYTMHRFMDDQLPWIREAQQTIDFISISIGVKEEDIRLIENIKKEGLRVHYVTIDVAHGHHPWVTHMIKTVNANLSSMDTKIIAGNVATPEGAKYLWDNGAHAVKVGIGQGRACTTKDKTGFTLPMFTCVRDIYNKHPQIPIVADGGIRCNGDIAKALVAGADMIMAGSVFAQLYDSPAPVKSPRGGVEYKEYYGSASEHNDNKTNNIEGTLVELPCDHRTYLQYLSEIEEDLQSSISYAGQRGIQDKVMTDTEWAYI